MNTCAFLLILTVQIYADGIEGPTGKEQIHLDLLNPVGKFLHVDENSTESKSGASLVKVPTLCPLSKTRCCVNLRLAAVSHCLLIRHNVNPLNRN